MCTLGIFDDLRGRIRITGWRKFWLTLGFGRNVWWLTVPKSKV